MSACATCGRPMPQTVVGVKNKTGARALAAYALATAGRYTEAVLTCWQNTMVFCAYEERSVDGLYGECRPLKDEIERLGIVPGRAHYELARVRGIDPRAWIEAVQSSDNPREWGFAHSSFANVIPAMLDRFRANLSDSPMPEIDR